MTRSRLRVALLIAVPLLAVSLLVLPRALAGGWCHHPRASTPAELATHLSGGLDRLLDKVDATDSQREAAEAIAERRAPELFALMSEGRTARQALKQALLADQLDRARLAETRARIDALAQRASDVGLSSAFELAEVLTPAQRKQLADRLARFEH